jgi:hypothetical protein
MSTIIAVQGIKATWNYDSRSWESSDKTLASILNDAFDTSPARTYSPYPAADAVDSAKEAFPNLVLINLDEQEEEIEGDEDTVY